MWRFKWFDSTSISPQECNIARYFTTRLDTLKDAVLFLHEATGHPNFDILSRHSPPGRPPELIQSVVRKYFPTTCNPIGNLQSTDTYEHFEASIFGQTELDLRVWTTVDGKRAYSLKTCIDLLTCMLFGSIITSMLRWIHHLCVIFRMVGHPLTLVRADNEFDTEEIRCFPTDIEMVFSRPHQKNKTHRVERPHRTVQEMVVKMINGRTYLNFRFWAFAFNHALALLNISGRTFRAYLLTYTGMANRLTSRYTHLSHLVPWWLHAFY